MFLCLQIMKSDEDVRMISAEAPVLFAKVNAATSVHDVEQLDCDTVFCCFT